MPKKSTLLALISRWRLVGLIGLSASVLCCAWRVAAQATVDLPALRVQILNGKTGRPLVNQKIVLMGDDGVPKDAARSLGNMMTDGEGYVSLPDVSAPLVNVEVFVEWHQPCSKAGKRSFPLVKVRTSGVVSENSCRPRITLFPQAGTLIFFVRDETFFEKMRH